MEQLERVLGKMKALPLFDEADLEERSIKFMAIYFSLGSPYDMDDFNRDKSMPKEWIGLDSTFEDSFILYARTEKELADKIEEVWRGEINFDLEEQLPEVICDMGGNLIMGLLKLIYGKDYDPALERWYSWGKETNLQFWEREKWRFI